MKDCAQRLYPVFDPFTKQCYCPQFYRLWKRVKVNTFLYNTPLEFVHAFLVGNISFKSISFHVVYFYYADLFEFFLLFFWLSKEQTYVKTWKSFWIFETFQVCLNCCTLHLNGLHLTCNTSFIKRSPGFSNIPHFSPSMASEALTLSLRALTTVRGRVVHCRPQRTTLVEDIVLTMYIVTEIWRSIIYV